MSEKRLFVLAHPLARQRAIDCIREAEHGCRVTVAPPSRTLPQNARLHAICSDLARSGLEWAGSRRTADQWKVLLVSGHAIATGGGADLAIGLEGELVNLRESTAEMSRARGSSLIDYAQAFCAERGVRLGDFEALTA